MVRRLLIFVLIVNLCYSLYQFEAYAYYVKTSIGNIQEMNTSGKHEWAIKLAIDTIGILLMAIWMRNPKWAKKINTSD